ncbi:MAG: SDR family oxidoreductase [Anaerolineales bacterium]|nr:SDR family oxidoreductase [Anaerolineales bacterium]
MRLLITGGSSFLGQHLVPLAAASHEICYTTFHNDPLGLPQGRPLDLRQETAVQQLAAAFRPDVIIHTAGSNRVADMRAVIESGTRHITAAAADVQARLIHLSTDSIFNGRSDDPNPPPYSETSPPSPVNAYGEAKATAEAIVAAYPDHVIVRTSLIYSLQQQDHSIGWMAAALKAGKPVTLFTNQRRNPVWAQTLSLACLELATNGYHGILNVAGQQVMTRAEFGLTMLDWWQVEKREKVELGPSLAGEWPLDCELDLRRATAVLKTPLLGVNDVLMQAAKTH